MKKVLAIVLVLVMVFAVSACGKSSTPSTTSTESSQKAPLTSKAPETPPQIVGGYEFSGDPTMTEDATAALNKALELLTGANYEPIALLGTQVVSGTNYMILCVITPVIPDAQGYYALVTVYKTLQGECVITRIDDSIALAAGDAIPGGWYREMAPASDEDKELVAKATKDLLGAEYEAIYHLQDQVVAGKNHMILCRMTPVTQNPQSSAVILSIYQDLQNNVTLNEIFEFTPIAQ